MIKKFTFFFAAILSSGVLFSQVPVIGSISGPNVACSAPGAPSSYTVSATNSPTIYTWFVVPSTGVVITNANSASVTISFPNTSNTFTVYCTASNMYGISNAAAAAVTVYETPTVTFSGNSTTFCQGSSTNLSASSTMLSASSTLSYSWTPSTGLSNTTGSAVVASPPSTTNYTVLLNNNGCTNSAQVLVTVNQFAFTASPLSQTVCLGTSALLTGSGAQTYSWSTGANSATVKVMPSTTSSYTVAASGNGCQGQKVLTVSVNSNCSDVWPGDANSDGVVNTSDVLELGLAYLNTGAPRSSISNNYNAFTATNWTGNVSTGKNKCHADCNGDGTVDQGDTLAIYNNFSMTHSFRSSGAAAGAGITLVSHNNNEVAPGQWGKLDIMLGESGSPLTAYGLLFDINFDASLIEKNTAGIVYTSSFFNDKNDNIGFRKVNYNQGMVYAANVRTNGSDATGSGKIGEFHFLMKPHVTEGTILPVSVSSARIKKHAGAVQTISSGKVNLTVKDEPVGMKDNLQDSFNFYPNPVSENLYLNSSSGQAVTFSIMDISGRVVNNGSFSVATRISTSGLAAGTYFITFRSALNTSTQKLLIQR